MAVAPCIALISMLALLAGLLCVREPHYIDLYEALNGHGLMPRPRAMAKVQQNLQMSANPGQAQKEIHSRAKSSSSTQGWTRTQVWVATTRCNSIHHFCIRIKFQFLAKEFKQFIGALFHKQKQITHPAESCFDRIITSLVCSNKPKASKILINH